jgi:hypothetical protein
MIPHATPKTTHLVRKPATQHGTTNTVARTRLVYLRPTISDETWVGKSETPKRSTHKDRRQTIPNARWNKLCSLLGAVLYANVLAVLTECSAALGFLAELFVFTARSHGFGGLAFHGIAFQSFRVCLGGNR